MKNLFFILILIVAPDKFIEMATEDVIKKEFASNQQLLSRYPDKKLPPERRLEMYNQMKESSLRLRASIINSFLTLLATILGAIIMARLFKFFPLKFSPQVLNILRFLSLSLIFWSFWGKLGWEIQTINGNTLPEILNHSWTKVLYLSGVFIMMFTYFL